VVHPLGKLRGRQRPMVPRLTREQVLEVRGPAIY
jgi:hypothetical protein